MLIVYAGLPIWSIVKLWTAVESISCAYRTEEDELVENESIENEMLQRAIQNSLEMENPQRDAMPQNDIVDRQIERFNRHQRNTDELLMEAMLLQAEIREGMARVDNMGRGRPHVIGMHNTDRMPATLTNGMFGINRIYTPIADDANDGRLAGLTINIPILRANGARDIDMHAQEMHTGNAAQHVHPDNDIAARYAHPDNGVVANNAHTYSVTEIKNRLMRTMALLCPSCPMPFDKDTRKPYVGICGHTLCESCLETGKLKWMEGCPICSGRNLFSRPILNKTVMDFLKNCTSGNCESLIRCKSCTKKYNLADPERRRPIVGTCGHTFCEACVRGFDDGCPLCEESNSYADMVTNRILIDVICYLQPEVSAASMRSSETQPECAQIRCRECGGNVDRIVLCKKCNNPGCGDANYHLDRTKSSGYGKLMRVVGAPLCVKCVKEKHKADDKDLLEVSKKHLIKRYESKLAEISKVNMMLLLGRKTSKILSGLKEAYEDQVRSQMGNGDLEGNEFKNRLSQADEMAKKFKVIGNLLRQLMTAQEEGVWRYFRDVEGKKTQIASESRFFKRYADEILVSEAEKNDDVVKDVVNCIVDSVVSLVNEDAIVGPDAGSEAAAGQI